MKILYVATGVFPYGSAYASRLINFSRILKEIGIDVYIITDHVSDKSIIDNQNEGIFENIHFKIIDSNPSSLTRLTNPWKCRKILIKFLNNHHIDIAILSSSFDRFGLILPEFKRRDIKVILESCEWFHESTWKGWIINPYYYLYQYSWKKLFTRVDGVIVISRLLKAHYLEHVESVIRIPAVLDAVNTKFIISKSNSVKKITYAGNPGKSKEDLYEILRALRMFGDNENSIEMHILGVNKEGVLKNINGDLELLNTLSKRVMIHGKIPQSEVNDILASSDYSIFMRPDRRSSHAGFPTKLAESLAVGTPVICNDTGDITMYIENNYNGFIVANNAAQLFKLLKRIIDIPNEDYISMRSRARETALKKFDYRNYKVILYDFLARFKSKRCIND